MVIYPRTGYPEDSPQKEDFFLSIGSAFRAFFSLLGGKLPEDIAREHGYVRPVAVKPVAPAPQYQPSDGALQILSILQRDARLIDFLMEDIAGYDDEQIGAAARSVHQQSRETLDRYLKLVPIVDGVEGDFTKIDGDGSRFKLIGNVPASGKAPGGTLRHKGWKAEHIDLPKLTGSVKVIAPAEIEIE